MLSSFRQYLTSRSHLLAILLKKRDTHYASLGLYSIIYFFSLSLTTVHLCAMRYLIEKPQYDSSRV